ncbi:MAG: hypothetical protein DRN20_04990 [Thermoplasmata archaeon]|nr:MAG: hypothetical protein DRN20_04990 [Thermoplasmata archaeon]
MKRVSGVLERLEELFNERNIEALHRAFKKNEKLTEFDGIATQMADYVMPLKITVDAIQEAEKLDINLTARWGIVLDEIKDEVAQLDDAIKQKYCEFIEREEKKKQRKKKRKEVGDEGHTDSRRRDSQANA